MSRKLLRNIPGKPVKKLVDRFHFRFYSFFQKNTAAFNFVRLNRIRPSAKSSAPSTSGFTIAELLTAVVIIGLLAAIAVPGWRSFSLNRSLTMAQDEVFQAIRQTQAAAASAHLLWQASFRDTGNSVQWAVHPATAEPNAIVWQPLFSNVQIDVGLTTLAQQSQIYNLQFNEQGNLNGQLGKLTLRTDSDRSRRCIIASTLLGTLRKAADQDCF